MYKFILIAVSLSFLGCALDQWEMELIGPSGRIEFDSALGESRDKDTCQEKKVDTISL
jgi:hypothetical protein